MIGFYIRLVPVVLLYNLHDADAIKDYYKAETW